MAAVALDNVVKAFEGGRVAVAGATFEVADGELVVLLGPSGCGKSTLLRIIAGLETPTSGTVRIGGRIVNELAPKDRDVAMVFQSYALYPHMTVEQNLGFSLELRGTVRAERAARVRKVAELLGLEGLLERLPRQLSGGQRQRVALGRALVREPQVFLFDEPLSNLDARLRLAMRTEIARLHRWLRTTMIYVTHDQVEAMTLAQRIVVLNGGEIQQIDTPMRVYERPANLFVAGFVGSPAMNFMRGRWLPGSGAGLDLGFVRVALDGAHGALCALPEGAEVVAGLRPEDLHLAGAGAPAAGQIRLSAQLELIEPVGNETFLTARVGSAELVLRTPPQALPAVGEPVALSFAPQRLHLFEAATGRRL
ncbi:MAG: sn-glycerol-3-phosphate ABC transporter ATP-binding protein UgpC [Gammaproteobacteria bacterium]|nr:sn-glycerol-3-phosphate ABC transporter ATP-binding protein UgpC [Gammaproteobacteria bacterium]